MLMAVGSADLEALMDNKELFINVINELIKYSILSGFSVNESGFYIRTDYYCKLKETINKLAVLLDVDWHNSYIKDKQLNFDICGPRLLYRKVDDEAEGFTRNKILSNQVK